jgi:hypothetical protein
MTAAGYPEFKQQTAAAARAARSRAWPKANPIEWWRWSDRYGAHDHGDPALLHIAHRTWRDVHAHCLPIALADPPAPTPSEKP